MKEHQCVRFGFVHHQLLQDTPAMVCCCLGTFQSIYFPEHIIILVATLGQIILSSKLSVARPFRLTISLMGTSISSQVQVAQLTFRWILCISLQFTSAVRQFELFVSGHMYVLADQPKQEDVLQLALLLPESSEVCRQATAMVRGDRKKSWFKWRYVWCMLRNITVNNSRITRV